MWTPLALLLACLPTPASPPTADADAASPVAPDLAASPPGTATYRDGLLHRVGRTAFRHDAVVLDVHVEDDQTLLGLAGCQVYRWSRTGTLLGTTELEGCRGEDVGRFSPDGAWVTLFGIRGSGAGAVWRRTGEKVADDLSHLGEGTLCGGALWWREPRADEIHRRDLATGEVSTFPGRLHDARCIGDAWMMLASGVRMELDGPQTERVRSLRVSSRGVRHAPLDLGHPVGQTPDGRALVANAYDRSASVARDGEVTWIAPLPWRTKEAVVTDDGLMAYDGYSVVAVGTDGRLRGGPYLAGPRRGGPSFDGPAPLFSWQGQPWVSAGRVVFPVGEPVGPVYGPDSLDAPYDAIDEVYFFDDDELFVCHDHTCEGYPLAEGGQPRAVALPVSLTGWRAIVSPHGRFLAQEHEGQLVRTDLGTGAWTVAADVGDGEWLALDRRGQARPDAAHAPRHDDARWAHVSDDGHVFRLDDEVSVFAPGGQRVARKKERFDEMGPWSNGAWLSRGQQILFVGTDLEERARLTLPFAPVEDQTIVGVGSPDGRFFAAQRSDGTIEVWQVGAARSLPAPETAADQPPFVPERAIGDTVRAANWVPPLQPLAPPPDELPQADRALLGGLGEAAHKLLAMASFSPRTAEERLDQLEVLYLQPDEGQRWLRDAYDRWAGANDPVGPVVTPGAAADGSTELLRVVEEQGLDEAHQAYARWRAARPALEGRAFDLPACHLRADERSLVPPRPPAEAGPPGRLGSHGHQDGIVVAVSAQGQAGWVATLTGAPTRYAQACWQRHRRGWTPASLDGQPASMCVVVPCDRDD